MIQPVSSKYFYDWLVTDVQDMDGLTLYMLYADLKRFMVLCDQKNEDKDLIMKQAEQIFKDYIIDGAEFELQYNEVLRQLKEGYRSGRIFFDVNETLFANLILFAKGGLDVYYE